MEDRDRCQNLNYPAVETIIHEVDLCKMQQMVLPSSDKHITIYTKWIILCKMQQMVLPSSDKHITKCRSRSSDSSSTF